MTAHQPTAERTHRCMGKQGLTWHLLPPATDAHVDYDVFMRLEPKERVILKYVRDFGQLSTKQIKALVYPGQAHDPQRRAIKHLLKYKLIALVKEPMKGGPHGGGQPNVYQLGLEGKKHYRTTRSGLSVTVRYHLLAIADVYIALFEESRRNPNFKIVKYLTEPDSHLDGEVPVKLEPDLHVEIAIRQSDGSARLLARFIEVDLGSERQRQVLDQVTAYKLAYESKEDYPLKTFPKVIFLAINDERKADIEYWMKRAKDLPDIFTVGTLGEVLSILKR